MLGSYQKLTRVLSGKPFGSGADGNYSSATIPTLTKDSCSGTATSTTLATAGSTFANGDILLIHQTRGTGVGQWEINKVVSGGGTTSLTLKKALQYTYTDSGNSQAQATKIPQYKNVTVQAGTWTLADWAGNYGGFLVIAANGTVTVTGTATGTGKGFTGSGGGQAPPNTALTATSGEGTVGAGVAQSTSANGDGGGGGGGNTSGSSRTCGGGGGGHAVAGTDGQTVGSGGVGGTGGSQAGSADLTTLVFGGGGGGGAAYDSSVCSIGGDSGGIILIFSKNLVTTGAINSNGDNGSNAGSNNIGGAGGGAGGSILIVCATATLGTNLITATAGSGGAGYIYSGNGGAGAVGRIAVHHSGTVTGTTNPSFTDVSDPSLKESVGGAFLLTQI